MLSVDCPAPLPLPTPTAAVRATPGLPLRRLAVTFAPERRRPPGAQRARREDMARVSVPVYSCITFHDGTVCVR